MKNKKRSSRFSASKRDFLKKMALFGVYIGPAIRTFEIAEITGKPTGPTKKEKTTTGTVSIRRPSGKSELV